jgi:putative inorganic carbon (hco3(-)) transporter
MLQSIVKENISQFFNIPKMNRNIFLFAVSIYLFVLTWALFQQNELLLSIVSVAPFALSALIIMLFYKDYALYAFLFCVPFSAKIEISGIGFSFPSEILMVILGFLFSLKLAKRKTLNPKILQHPISILLFFLLIIYLFSTLYSEIFWVAVKRSIIHAFFYGVFYLSFAHEFEDEKKIERFWNFQIWGMIPVVLFTLIRHSASGFSQTDAPPQSFPFYIEHAVYGACLAFVMPYLFLKLYHAKVFAHRGFGVLLLLGINILFLFAQFAASSRAAWLGLVVAIAFSVLLQFRISFYTFLFLCFAGMGISFFFQDDIYLALQGNEAESRTEKIDEQLASVANVKTDVSNLERVNRWACALEMAEKRPVLGWGPGNYEGNYGGFQHWFNLTRISTHSGNRGNAHSEYLMVFAETGFLGLIPFLLIIFSAIFTGMKVVYKTENPKLRIFAISALLGLISYFVLGIFNSFLDQDEAAVWVWGAMAMLVQLSVRKGE